MRFKFKKSDFYSNQFFKNTLKNIDLSLKMEKSFFKMIKYF